MKKTHLKIGAIVREYRTNAGLTQMELAEKLGYDSPQFVSLFERGFSKVPVDTLGQLISILGIPEKVVLSLLLSDFESEVKSKIAEGKYKA